MAPFIFVVTPSNSRSRRGCAVRFGFKGLQSFKTHDLEILLWLSGIEDRIRARSGRWF
jgi:hypothetical protein